MLDNLKKKYNTLTEHKSPTVLLAVPVAATIGLTTTLVIYRRNLIKGGAELTKGLFINGVYDYDFGTYLLRVTKVNK